MKAKTEVDVEGKHLVFSNLDKVFYPETGFTKGELIEYYSRIAPVLLPHLKDRPLTLKRYPDGVDGMFFYEKQCPSHRPNWLKTVDVWSEGNQRMIGYCLAEDLPSLLWAANLAVLELHTSLSKAQNVDRPTMMVFDLDPGPPAGIVDCAEVALWLREIFDNFDMQSFPKTSGSKGLQVYVPLNTSATYDDTKSLAHSLARMLEQQHPQKVLSVMRKDLREGKVFVDWSQNDRHKTTVCAYSLRAKERPTVSTPVTWKEVEAALKRKHQSPLSFDSAEVLRRVEKHGDLFAPVLTLKQKMPKHAPV
ncbi:MAG TPA: non-homologous end-joining DNA ligase [Planctomycetota bacterium]|jgi:bifunctional non-homologous end joining protein LigD